MTDEQRRDRVIQEVLSGFDFDKVHKAMVATNWTWKDQGVPTRDELVAEARRLLEEAWNGKCCIRSGGFSATYVSPDPEDRDWAGELNLWFWLERNYVNLDDISLLV